MNELSADNIMTILHPGMIMIIAGIIVMLLPKVFSRPLGIIAPLTAAWAFIQMTEESSLQYELASYIKMEFIHLDGLARTFMIAFCIIALLNGLYSQGIQHKYECGMSMIYTGSTMGTVLAGDCISMIFFLEISVIASAYIVYCRHDRAAGRASFRYILVHALGGNMLLAGLIVYMFHYGNNLGHFSECMGEPCFWLIAAGLAVSAAVPPLHAWLPDACPESTAAGGVYLASFATRASVYLVLRMMAGISALIWIGAFAAIYGACMALMENDIRRLLSYNIVVQTGITIAAAGAGGAPGTDAAAAQAFTGIILAGVLMMGAGTVLNAAGRSKITELGGLAGKMPVTAACFLINSLAAAGLPGLSGYVSSSIMTAAISEGGFTIPSMLLTAGSVGVLLSITLKLNYYVFFGPCNDPAASSVENKIPFTMNLAMIAGTAVSAAIGLYPQMLCSLLPYGTIAELYDASYVLRAAAIITGASVPFFICLKKMKPGDEISLDFDWLSRIALNRLILRLQAAARKQEPLTSGWTSDSIKERK